MIVRHMRFDEIDFEPVEESYQLNELIYFMRRKCLDYKGYNEWVERARYQILRGEKVAMIARYNGNVVGDIVGQGEKKMGNFFEIKNARVEEEFRGEYLGKLMFRAGEKVAKRSGFYGVIGDVRERDELTCNFMREMGYETVARLPLYESDKPDLVFVKLF